LLNVNGFFNSLNEFFNQAVQEHFVREEHRNNIFFSEDPEELIQMLNNYHPVTIEKWIRDIKNERSIS
jgi:predicted Rossmann-fold nucleotide-binding protein